MKIIFLFLVGRVHNVMCTLLHVFLIFFHSRGPQEASRPPPIAPKLKNDCRRKYPKQFVFRKNIIVLNIIVFNLFTCVAESNRLLVLHRLLDPAIDCDNYGSD